MKSYKEVVKSYKDIDKEIILNAPEGAMWWCDVNGYYKFVDGTMYYYASWNEWALAGNFQGVADIHAGHSSGIRCSLKPIPLPNIEIPWEATADSECPVPDGFKVKVSFVDGCNSTDSDPEGWNWTNANHLAGSKIVSYKIIDEEYLAEANLTTDMAGQPGRMYTFNQDGTVPKTLRCDTIVSETLNSETLKGDNSEEQLINKLRFLQNLAKEFPEIYNEMVAEMKIQFECYCEEHLND